MPSGQRTQDHNERLGEAMRELGWVRRLLRFGRPNPEWCYVKGEGEGRKVRVHRRIVVDLDQRGRPRAGYEREREPF